MPKIQADPEMQKQYDAWAASQNNKPFTNNPSGLQNNQNPSVIQQLFEQANSYDTDAEGTRVANAASMSAASQNKFFTLDDWKKAKSEAVANANGIKSQILGKAVDALIKTSQPDPLPNDVQGKLADYDTSIASLHLLQQSYNKALNKSGAIFGGNFKATMGDWLHSNQTNSDVKQFETLKEALTPSIAQGLGYLQGADARPTVQTKIEEILPGANDTLPDANAKLYNLETLALNRKASLLHEYGFGNYQVANQTKETQDQFADLANRQKTVGQMYDAFNQPPAQSNPSATPAASPSQPTIQGQNTSATQGFNPGTQNYLNSWMQARQAQLQKGVNTAGQ